MQGDSVNPTINYYRDLEQKREAPKQELDKDAFLQILVAQLRSQDPLNPVKSEEFIGQLAQLSSLEQLTSLNKNTETFQLSFLELFTNLQNSLGEIYGRQEELRAMSLLDKEVVMESEDGRLYGGKVTGVELGAQVGLVVDGWVYPLDTLRFVGALEGSIPPQEPVPGGDPVPEGDETVPLEGSPGGEEGEPGPGVGEVEDGINPGDVEEGEGEENDQPG